MADLQRLRDDLGYFADAIGEPLMPWQLAALRLATVVSVLLWGRQLGKSRGLAVLSLHWALTRPGNRVFILSAGEGGAKRLLAEIRRIAMASPLLRGSVVDEAAMLVTLSNGSEIRCAPASSSSIRGWQNDLLIVDEAGSPTADVVLSAALPTITAREGARVVLADTAWAAEGPFYDFAMNGLGGSPDVRTFRCVARTVNADDPDAVDAPWVTPTAVRLARESMGWRFSLEYEVTFGGASDTMFSRALLARCAAPYVVSGLADFSGRARLLGGVDWAAKHDHSACVGWGRLPIASLNPGLGLPVFGIALVEHWPAGEPLDHVVNALGASAVHWDTLSIETNGIGEYPAQRLVQALGRGRGLAAAGGRRGPTEGVGKPPPGARSVWLDSRGRTRWSTSSNEGGFTSEGSRGGGGDMRSRGGDPGRVRPLLIATSADLKSQTFGRLRFLMDRGQVVIPAETELLRELLSLRLELRPAGGVGIEAAAGRHDDLAMSAMLGCGPYRHKRVEVSYRDRLAGQWRSLLTDAAEWGVPEAAVGASGEVVETGAGLLMPRLPTWQSVFGGELSRPADARRAAA
jgi:hypothetical protein